MKGEMYGFDSEGPLTIVPGTRFNKQQEVDEPCRPS